MLENRYNRIVLARIEENLDRIMPVGAIAAAISAVAIYYSTIPHFFVIIDMSVALILFLLSVLRNVISRNTKIYVTIFIPIVIGVLSFLDGGFNSAGITLILISNVIAVMFLIRKQSVIIGVFSIALFIVLWLTTVGYKLEGVQYVSHAEWIIQLCIYILFIFILHIIVYTIRKHLLYNIEELELSINKSNRYAYYDQLTGLPNLNMFKKLLIEREADHDGVGHLALYNLKGLSVINSLYGDGVGDTVLIETAKMLEKSSCGRYLVSRISGNEFALWFEKVEEEAMILMLEEINTFFGKEFQVEGMMTTVEFYITYASYGDNDSILTCYQKANLVLAYVKNEDKMGITPYDESFEKIIRNHEEMKEYALEAIHRNLFDIYYQNKIDATNNQVVGVEALSRWHCERLGEISPSVFIPLIESIHQSVAFGELVIKKVFSDYKMLRERYHEDIKVSINISPSHLLSDKLIDYLEEQLRIHNIDSKKVVLEITEEVFLGEGYEVNQVLNQIKNLGFMISLDDFGTGYSSFNYLLHMDVDEIKIDKSFIDQINQNDKALVLLESIIHAAKGLGLTLVAEGVETKWQRDELLELGCYIIQGYYYSIPAPLEPH